MANGASARLADRVAIVTGGSRGIGRAIAQLFTKEGARLVIVGRDRASGDDAVATIVKAGGDAVFVAGDVAAADTSAAMVATAIDRFGRLDILCHNAGIFPEARLDDMTEAEWDRVLDVNLKSAFLATRACLPAMRAQRYGRIVFTSSITGPIVGNPGLAHYSASKAGMEGFIRTAAIECAADGITINAVEPGNILTEGLAGTLGQKHIDAMTAAVPMGRLGEPIDIAWAALFLAGDESRYITGQRIVVDGGQTLPETRSGVN
jgi:3-oxoacyl-[acyl-carrier protein] reductase